MKVFSFLIWLFCFVSSEGLGSPLRQVSQSRPSFVSGLQVKSQEKYYATHCCFGAKLTHEDFIEKPN